MKSFPVLNKETAPQESQSLLDASQKAFGMIPNLHGVMAASAPVLEGYQVLHELFQKTSFNAEELTVVWQSINVEHECHYCVPAHTAIAHSMKVDSEIIDALRNKTPLSDIKLETLRQTTLAIVRQRGRLTDEQLEDFYAQGYQSAQLQEIILGLAQKVMSNYINHLADTPVDAPFAKFA